MLLIVLPNDYNNFKLHMNTILETGFSTSKIHKDIATTLSLHGTESLNISQFTLDITSAVSQTKKVLKIFFIFKYLHKTGKAKFVPIKKHFRIY